jgi:dolichyl-phosphate beta-glucosyltransferase
MSGSFRPFAGMEETPTAPYRCPLVHRSLSVVIPSFNESARLPSSLRDVHKFLVDRGYDAEILVVDDGSKDGTRDQVEKLRSSLPLVRVLGYEQNKGKGFAVKTGVLASTREAILFSDADLSTPIAELDRLWTWFDRGYDIVAASRAKETAEILVRQPFYREWIGRIFNAIISMVLIRGIRDTQCGFKLFRREIARQVFSNLRTNGFAFDVEVLAQARKLGFKIAEVGVRWINSTTSQVHPLKDSARMLLEILRIRRFL